MSYYYRNSLLLCLVLLVFSIAGYATVKLPALVADGMVLQRDADVKIWGWADPGESFAIRFLDADHEITANAEGEWELRLGNLEAGGPYTMEILAGNTISIRDILIGDVWICSGQSNMELPMRRVKPLYEQDIAEAGNSFIRYFEVPKRYNFNEEESDLPSGTWQRPDPESVLGFSAVAYFFALDLYEKYEVPIGLINTSLGGSPAEAWMSEEALKAFPGHLREARRFRDETLIKSIEKKDRERMAAWFAELNKKDLGHNGPGKNWKDPSLNTEDWTSMEVPGYWADASLGPLNGVVWFRKTFDLPENTGGKAAYLNLGRIVDSDSVFINGQFIGSTGYQYPPRWYQVPPGVLKAGSNSMVVRVVNERGKGGFVPDKPYYLEWENERFELSGTWAFRTGAEMQALAGQTFIRWKPEGLFNAMISPLLNYSMKGVIWYQGESNAERPEEYQKLFPSMIRDWRKRWDQGEFPFLFVQLANFMEPVSAPAESNWAALRDAQLQTLALPNTGMAVAIDLGEWNDIHPLNKKDVAHRLALAARKVAYHEDIVYSGPIFKSMEIKGNRIILTFNNTGSGLKAKGGALKQFAIAGADTDFVWAKARISGKDKVEVWSDRIDEPTAVCYAWADNPEGANLYNEEGLPASPFKTQ